MPQQIVYVKDIVSGRNIVIILLNVSQTSLHAFHSRMHLCKKLCMRVAYKVTMQWKHRFVLFNNVRDNISVNWLEMKL